MYLLSCIMYQVLQTNANNVYPWLFYNTFTIFSRNESLSHCPNHPDYKYVIDEGMQQYLCAGRVMKDGKLVYGEYNEGKITRRRGT